MKNNTNTYVKVSDILETNGKTIKENNLERKHQIPLDTLVYVNLVVNKGQENEFRFSGKMYVSEHTRDCDGEPLYHLSTLKGMKALKEEYMQMGMNERVAHHVANSLKGSFHIGGYSESNFKLEVFGPAPGSLSYYLHVSDI